MKSISKAFRIPEPLAEGLRIAAHKKYQNQTQFLRDALVMALESLDDPMLNGFVHDYKQHAGELEEAEEQSEQP